ncbi:MAG: MarR family transcriptional regulator [Pseudomonadota bacterium]
MPQPVPHTPAEPLSKLRLRVWLKLLRATNALQDEIRRRLREDHHTTLPRFDVMAAIDRYPDGLKMSEISGLLRVSNGNVTGIVDRLAEEGLLVREAVPGDRRAQRVRLTEAGRAVFAGLAAAHETWIDTALSALDADGAERMLRRLDMLATGAKDAE